MAKTTARAIIVFVLVALFLFYEMGVQVSPSVMTHQLMHALNLSTVGLGFMSGFYFYTYTIMQIPAGILLDRFGVRQIVATALLVCAAGCAIFGFSHSIVGGSLARLLTGFGSAFAFVSVLAVAERWFQAKYFALLAGITQLFAALGAMGGQWPLAFSVHAFGWRDTLFALALISLIIAALVGVYVKEPPQSWRKECQHCDQSIRKNLKSILTSRQTWFVWIYALCNWAPMSAFASLWGVPFLVHVYGMTTLEAASFSGLTWIGIGIASPLIGYFSDYIKQRKVILIATPLIGLICAWLIVEDPGMSHFTLGALLFLMGAACSGQVLSFAVVKDNAPQNAKATAIAINNMGVVAAGVIVQPLVGILLKLYHHYQTALVVLPIVFAISLVLAVLAIKESYRSANG